MYLGRHIYSSHCKILIIICPGMPRTQHLTSALEDSVCNMQFLFSRESRKHNTERGKGGGHAYQHDQEDQRSDSETLKLAGLQSNRRMLLCGLGQAEQSLYQSGLQILNTESRYISSKSVNRVVALYHETQHRKTGGRGVGGPPLTVDLLLYGPVVSVSVSVAEIAGWGPPGIARADVQPNVSDRMPSGHIQTLLPGMLLLVLPRRSLDMVACRGRMWIICRNFPRSALPWSGVAFQRCMTSSLVRLVEGENPSSRLGGNKWNGGPAAPSSVPRVTDYLGLHVRHDGKPCIS